jgi:hypothetical protein
LDYFYGTDNIGGLPRLQRLDRGYGPVVFVPERKEKKQILDRLHPQPGHPLANRLAHAGDIFYVCI